MMNASLDTDIVIHLYKSGKKDLLFSNFDDLFIYEYLLETEMKTKSLSVYEEFKKDIDCGRVKLITNVDLVNMGVKGLFEEYKESNKYLFDIGELHAIALAKAMGILAFVSDDTKDEGPHQTLVKELIEGVMPFAFYELLFLKYLNSQISLQEMFDYFEDVNSSSMSQHPMNFRTKISLTVRRFSRKYGSKRDNDWLENYCNEKDINLKGKMQELKTFLKAL
ncbi:hypothetical protein [Clostridium thailandense]|uniref:hypothetical protein n=1 Tax=Clostridium thailandense TaxID=2794346 RepID=UPI0039898A22